MKYKIIALSLIITSAFSTLAGCSNGNSELSEPTTISSTEQSDETTPTERDDIDYTASYDKENKEINSTLTNNTGDDIIYYNHIYSLYKKVGNEWESTGFEYATHSMAQYLFPDEGINSVNFNHAAYNTAGENINFAEEKEKGGLEAGEYKITMEFDVYSQSEASTIPLDEGATYPPENPNGLIINPKNAKGEKVIVTAEFKVK